MAACLALLSAERGTEAIRLAERGGSGLHVELTRLREVRRFVVEVSLEQRTRAFARVGREMGASTKVKPSLLKNERTASMIVWRTRKIAC